MRWQERFRLDELGDDRLAAAAREVVSQFDDGSVRPAAIDRFRRLTSGGGRSL